MTDLVSVVIPCFNEELYIEGCIYSLNDGEYKNIEIIIVDGGSFDGTLNIINDLNSRFSNIRILSNPKKVTPISLNIGIKAAKGNFIMIAGAHSKFPPNYISELLNYQHLYNCNVVGGALETKVKNSNPKSNSIIAVLSNKFGVGNSSFRTEKEAILEVDTVPFGIYRKEVFNNIGGYNEALIRNHDIELSKRIAKERFKIILVSHVRCVYYAREVFSELAKNNYGNGYWNVLTVYITKDFKSLSIRHYVPLAFILSLTLPVVVSLFFYGPMILLSIVFLIIYLVFITMISFKMLKKDNSFWYLFGAFMTLHFSYGLGSLFGLFRFDKLRF
ncbi:glycosyl transferase [Tenuifilaceae bacterium CYCD]|nr:glycosyl transferase [Tenuifilaceae bacterium CYCD]